MGKRRSNKSYENGFISRSQIGLRLGIKGPSWHIVQKALIRAGYVKWDHVAKATVPTDKATGLCAVHREVTEQGEIHQWPIWSPVIVDLIRDAVVEVLLNPKPETSSNREGMREYPKGYLYIMGISKAVGCGPFTVIELLEEWGYAKKDQKSKSYVPVDDDDNSMLYEENGKSWHVWHPRLVDEFKEYFERNPEKAK